MYEAQLKEAGKRLKNLRGNQFSSKAAEQMGISPTSLYNYENGHKLPTEPRRQFIAKFYGTTQEKIWGENADKIIVTKKTAKPLRPQNAPADALGIYRNILYKPGTKPSTREKMFCWINGDWIKSSHTAKHLLPKLNRFA